MFKLSHLAQVVFALTLVTPGLHAATNSCPPPQFRFYGKRLDGFVYQCIKRLGSRPGITPPCAQMCPLNVTFAYSAKETPFIHITGIEEGHVDFPAYRTSVVFANCTLGILQAVWYGPAVTLFAGHKDTKSSRQHFHNLCSATPDPMPCRC